MTSVLYYLMRNPTAYQKLTAEVDAAFSDSTLSTPVAYKAAIKLPYLKACINESMRLHPGVALAMPREVPADGATISDFHFPAGYRVGINPAVVQYDKDIFGPDAEEFNPDRWLEGDEAQMERAMIQFGGGSRTCIGKHVRIVSN
jgi:cytochrome P450